MANVIKKKAYEKPKRKIIEIKPSGILAGSPEIPEEGGDVEVE